MSISATVFSEPLFNFNFCHYRRVASIHRLKPKPISLSSSSSSNLTLFSNYYDSWSWTFRPPHKFLSPKFEAFATNTDTLEAVQSSDVIFNQTFPINRVQLVLPFCLLFFLMCFGALFGL